MGKNNLENYVYSIRNTVNDPKVEGKIPAGDKDTITKVVDEAVKWLDAHQSGSKEDFDSKRAQVESTVAPLLQKISGGVLVEVVLVEVVLVLRLKLSAMRVVVRALRLKASMPRPMVLGATLMWMKDQISRKLINFHEYEFIIRSANLVFP